LARTSGFPECNPGSPTRSNILRQPGMPVLGTRHHEVVFGKHTGSVRTAHDVVPLEVEKDQQVYQGTVERVDNCVATLGEQNQKLTKDNMDLKKHMGLLLRRVEEDDAEIVRCKNEIDQHLGDLDVQLQKNQDLDDALSNEQAGHNNTKMILDRVQKELDAENAALAEARTKIIKDLEERNARLIEEARTERNAARPLGSDLLPVSDGQMTCS